MMSPWRASRIDVPCYVDIEQTPDSLHAHAIPEGIDIQPGDSVIVHGAPSGIGYGEHLRVTCVATVIRAGAIRRFWTRLIAPLEFLELFEAGFGPKEQA
jgi:hypothetical protein